MARREFCKQVLIKPLQQAIVELFATQAKRKLWVLDIGCGEGYYTSAMQAHTQHCIGVDIAKTAVTSCKTQLQSHLGCWDRCNIACTGSFNRHYVPLVYLVQFHKKRSRVLQGNGHLIVVTPAPRHLYRLREALFEQIKFTNQKNF